MILTAKLCAVLLPIFWRDPLQLPLCIYECFVEKIVLNVFVYFKSWLLCLLLPAIEVDVYKGLHNSGDWRYPPVPLGEGGVPAHDILAGETRSSRRGQEATRGPLPEEGTRFVHPTEVFVSSQVFMRPLTLLRLRIKFKTINKYDFSTLDCLQRPHMH